MALEAAWALQTGLYDALVTDTPLTDLLGGMKIHDDVPQHAQFPYVSISQSQTRDWSTGTETGHEHIVTLHVWSRASGKKQVHEIIGRLKDLLSDQTLTLTDHHLVNLLFDFSQVRRDPDGITYHGVARFRAVSETAA